MSVYVPYLTKNSLKSFLEQAQHLPDMSRPLNSNCGFQKYHNLITKTESNKIYNLLKNKEKTVWIESNRYPYHKLSSVSILRKLRNLYITEERKKKKVQMIKTMNRSNVPKNVQRTIIRLAAL